MKSNITKYYLLKSLSAYFITSALSLLSLTALAGGNGISGGGDTECEARIHEIQNELARWLNVKKDGPRLLKLPMEIKFEDYIREMSQFVYTEVECTSDKVYVEGTEKTCRFDLTHEVSEQARITCNTERFSKTKDDRQYQLIHHEIAGLAQLELPQGSRSKYDTVSDQISEFLEVVQVKKLAVKRNKQASPSPKTLEGAINIVVVESCKEAGFETYSEFIYSGDIPKLKTCVQDVYDGIEKLKLDPPGKNSDERASNRYALASHLSEISEKMYKIDLIDAHSQF